MGLSNRMCRALWANVCVRLIPIEDWVTFRVLMPRTTTPAVLLYSRDTGGRTLTPCLVWTTFLRPQGVSGPTGQGCSTWSHHPQVTSLCSIYRSTTEIVQN